MAINIESTAFEDGGMLPVKYSCDGGGVSPPLSWTGVPDGTESLALICEDPDATRGIFTHWILFNLPAETTRLEEDIPKVETLPNGAIQGQNSAGTIGYRPPCPPSGTHRYIFRLYALDTELDQEAGITREQLLDVMDGHILAQGELVSRYSRQ